MVVLVAVSLVHYTCQPIGSVAAPLYIFYRSEVLMIQLFLWKLVVGGSLYVINNTGT